MTETVGARPNLKRPRLLIVYPAPSRAEPRARRIEALRAGLGDRWEVECFPEPDSFRAAAASRILARCRGSAPRWLRRLVGRIRTSVLVDAHELSTRRSFRSFAPAADLALLVVHPFSSAFAAAAKLHAAGIPFVVDAGDPLTVSPAPVCDLRGLARARAHRAEHRLWTEAGGAIVTTEAFARTLRAAFPRLPVLVRPNGYEPVTVGATVRSARIIRSLRLAHFGTLYGLRIDPRPFLADLVSAGLWDEVTFDQYGAVWNVEIEVPGVCTRVHEALTWDEVIATATPFDAALVVGNRSGLGPPSKVFAYMTLPVPRVVLVADASNDETAAYVRRFASWLVLEEGDAANPSKLHAYVRRGWSPEELAPPASEAWPAVVDEIEGFLSEFVEGESWTAPGSSDVDEVWIAS